MYIFDLIDQFQSQTDTVVTFSRKPDGRIELAIVCRDDTNLKRKESFKSAGECQSWIETELKRLDQLHSL